MLKSILIDIMSKRIALITDIHSLLEPLEAVLLDIKNNNITEIYCLGDNVCDGPNPNEVIELLNKYNVISLKGNSEEYVIYGHKYFAYFKKNKIDNLNWTKKRLSKKSINIIRGYPHYIEMILGNKKICLCHFINDVRIDYEKHSVRNFLKNKNLYSFKYTNSLNEKIKVFLNKNKNPLYESCYLDPLFKGKKFTYYDYIFQGHAHFELYNEYKNTKIYNLRALAMAYENSDNNHASYTIIEDNGNDIKIEKKYVKYDRDSMINKIISSDLLDKDILLKYISYAK